VHLLELFDSWSCRLTVRRHALHRQRRVVQCMLIMMRITVRLLHSIWIRILMLEIGRSFSRIRVAFRLGRLRHRSLHRSLGGGRSMVRKRVSSIHVTLLCSTISPAGDANISSKGYLHHGRVHSRRWCPSAADSHQELDLDHFL
jgi:hypothetical protein